MPSLAELTDQYPQQDNTLPVEQPYRGANLGPLSAVGVPTGVVGGDPTVAPPPAPPDIYLQPTVGTTDYTNRNGAGGFGTLSGQDIVDKLIGLHGQERYQLWPEKVIRDAISAPHDIIQANPYPEGSEEASWFEDQRANKGLTSAALNMSALAGTGGLAGTGAELGEALGAGPFLRPALKVGDKIYKAPIKDAENPLGFGAEHSDALPAHLADDFYKKAMNGEDINHYNFGFVNHKGQFLDRSKALDYGIQQGLVDPQNGKYGVLTSTMLADSSKPGTAIEAMAKSQPFYSALEHNVNAIQQPKMTGDQWLGTLANKPGVKPEEMDWTGVKDFLKERGNQPVSKSELHEHLQNNKVELKEVDKGQAKNSHDDYIEGDELDPDYAHTISGTKYHSYQLPGGENYREKLLTLPVKTSSKTQEGLALTKRMSDGEFNSLNDIDRKALFAKRDKLLKEGSAEEGTPYKSSHWDEPNILAHVRMNDRTFPNPEYQNLIDKYGSYDNAAKSATKKEWETIEANKDKKTLKSLHLEEIQSDWHQQGRDKGYETERKAAMSKVQDLIKEASTLSSSDARYKEIYKELPQWQAKANERAVPDAPFKKSWHELALKRMIREAAEKGYDRLSWTPGEAQAARYDLSKSVDHVSYSDKGTLQAKKNDNTVMHEENVPKEKLADYIGKEAAKKLLESKSDIPGLQYLDGENLKIGGEGMKGFYDQIIPKALEKISGEKVKTAELPGKLSNKMGQPPETTKVHYIDIPQSLKDKALGKGFPLFSSTHIFTPVSHNPFEDKKK